MAGAVLCTLGVRDYQMAGMGIFAYTQFISPDTKDIHPMIIGIIVSIICVIVSFILELLFYKDNDTSETKAVETKAAEIKACTIASPLTGKTVRLEDVKDEVFSSGAMGKGVAIEPAEGKVFAPADGTISAFFPTGHAIAITTDDGAEILIHVGMDTVKMNGDGFNPKKNQGDKVKKGELLLEFDIDKIKKAGYPVTTPVIISNTDNFAKVIPTETADIKAGDCLIEIE